MKKLIRFVSSLILLIVFFMILSSCNDANVEFTDIYLSTYQNPNQTICVTKIPTDKVTYFNPLPIHSTIKDDIGSYLSKQKIWTEDNILIYGLNNDVGLTFIDNNYYCCYKDDVNYYISLVSCEIFYEYYHFFFPINMIACVNFSGNEELAEQELLKFFNKNTFASTVSYYEKFSDSVTINYEDKNIVIECFDINSNESIHVMLDFNGLDFKILKGNEYITM